MDPLFKLLSGLTVRQRITIALTAILTSAGIFGFTYWKRESDFRPLYTSMAPEDAAGVVQKLRESGVDFRLSESGSSVLVPSSKLAESRLALAAAGLPKTGRIGFELFDKTAFGATDFVEHINYKRALEGEIERSVMSLAEVQQARVHLTLPKESIFLDKQQPAKASVVLKLAPGARVSQQNVFAITNLVASAVEGLGANDVSIVDMNGNLLNRPRRASEGDGSQLTSEALEVRQQIERDLVSKIRSTLEPLIGADRFRAGASVDCDFTSADQQEETFDPGHSVMVSSQKTEDVTERAGASAGIPGTASNLPNPPPHSSTGPGGVSRRTENVAFQSSRVVKHTRIPQGVIRRMSLSVLLDHTVRWEGTGAAKRRILEPPTPETIKTIKDLVAASTGLTTARGDLLTVESLPFESSLNPEPPMSDSAQPNSKTGPPDPPWLVALNKYRIPIIGGVVGITVLLVVFRVVKRLRRKVPDAQVPPALPPANTQIPEIANVQAQSRALQAFSNPDDHGDDLAERVRQMVKVDTPVAANVLRLWMQENDTRPV